MKQTDAAPGLRTPLQFVKGVGPHRASQLERKGLRTVEDALFFVPLPKAVNGFNYREIKKIQAGS